MRATTPATRHASMNLRRLDVRDGAADFDASDRAGAERRAPPRRRSTPRRVRRWSDTPKFNLSYRTRSLITVTNFKDGWRERRFHSEPGTGARDRADLCTAI